MNTTNYFRSDHLLLVAAGKEKPWIYLLWIDFGTYSVGRVVKSISLPAWHLISLLPGSPRITLFSFLCIADYIIDTLGYVWLQRIQMETGQSFELYTNETILFPDGSYISAQKRMLACLKTKPVCCQGIKTWGSSSGELMSKLLRLGVR
ncbi:hypothetical protein C5167_016819 [Papaver somniferum]|nr:hypothetical protein C5167_016819 [Papaver somniferum]